MGLTKEQEDAVDNALDRAVTASAGTGKTFVLTRRFVDAVGIGAWPLDAMAAITFTELAASEMKRKVRDRVTKLAESGGTDGEAWDAVRDRLQNVTISTIHAFCAQVLRENPIEAGVDPGFIVISGVEESALVEEALSDLFDAAGSDPTIKDHATLLLKRFDQREIRDMLLAMSQHRAVADAIVGSEAFASSDNVREHWRSIITGLKGEALGGPLSVPEVKDALRTLGDIEPEQKGPRYISFVQGAQAFARDLVSKGPTAEVLNATPSLVRALFNDKRGYRKPGWILAGSSFGPGGKEALELAVQTLQPHLRDLIDVLGLELGPIDKTAAESVHALVALYGSFLDRYEARKQARGGLDFSDLLEKAERLLTDDNNAELLEECRRRYRYLLVDEFQDTDPVQWSIIRTLWGEGEGERRLFIVGDPKQSIYAFRDADVTVFDDARVTIDDLTRGRKRADDRGDELSTNFRSLKEIVEFVDLVFARLLRPRLGRGFEASYGRNPDTYRKKEGITGTIELILPPSNDDEDDNGAEDDDAPEGAAAELAAVAARIKQIVEGKEKRVKIEHEDGREEVKPASYSDIAILLQARTHLPVLQQELDALEVPFTIYKGTGFYQSQEVRDVASLLTALADRNDGIALLSVLRGPMFAISDDTLVRATLGSKDFVKSVEGFADDRADPDAEQVGNALAELERWRRLLDRVPLADLVSQAFDESGAWATYASLSGGSQQVANVTKLLQEMREFDAADAGSAAAYVRLLVDQIRSETKTGEASTGEDGGDAVRIMTVHGAKGLQFPVTVVPLMHRKPPAPRGFLLDTEVGPGLDVQDAMGKQVRSGAKQLIALREKERAWAEHKRLFYVAATRAKDHLILSGRPEELPKELPSAPMDNKTWLGWLLEAAGIWTDELPENEGTFLNGLVTVVVPPPETGTVAPAPSVTSLDEDDPVRSAPQDDDPALRPRPLPPRVERISPSRLKDYVNCPAAYRAKHVLRAPEPSRAATGRTTVSALARGRVVHAALERFLGGTFDESVVKAMAVEAGVALDHSPQLIDEARKAVEAFAASPTGRAALTSPRIMREQRILFSLERGPKKNPTIIECIIDLLYQDKDDSWHVVDYKTNNVNVGNCEERIKGTYALQMALYQLAVARATDANPENVKAMVFCTVPGIEVDMTADKAALAGVEDKVRAVLDAIEVGEFDAPATVAREEHICAGCPFRELTKCGETRWEYDPKEREGEPEPEELETSDYGTYEDGI